MVKALKYDNPDSEIKFDKSKKLVKVQGELITQVMNGTFIANRFNHQVLQIE